MCLNLLSVFLFFFYGIMVYLGNISTLRPPFTEFRSPAFSFSLGGRRLPSRERALSRIALLRLFAFSSFLGARACFDAGRLCSVTPYFVFVFF